MNCASAKARALLLVCVALAACQDPASAPLPITIVSQPATQTAGGVITLTSDQFSGLRLLPSPDTTRPNRWTNFAVLVGADTADSWRVGPTQIAFRVPPVYTGNHDASISARGYDKAQITFSAIGLAFPAYWAGLNPYTNVSTGTLLPGRGLLVAEETSWPGFTTGYGLVDAQTRTLQMFPELAKTGSNLVKMYAPGPSYRANHFIFDLSPSGSAAATVWSADPWTLVDTLPCSNASGVYTAAELSATTCLMMNVGNLVRNGTDTLLRDWGPIAFGDFRLAPGGTWAVMRTELLDRRFRGPVMPWPVLNQLGAVAYTIDTLFHVTGAAFSNAGDTLFITASVRDTTAANNFGGRFAVLALETATGRTVRARSFASNRALQDVILDPTRPVLYVGGVQAEPTNGNSHVRQYLTVLDRGTLDVIADIPAAGDFPVLDANLVYDGSAGRVSVVGWCGVDCGGLRVFTFDLP
jgi:IPT/TIG domain